ncbi:MAG: hypothetical protein IKL92_06420 [Oscillospiraceae bacterium]|nr:hypothetical protein [Oscillospiraceae bacterium]
MELIAMCNCPRCQAKRNQLESESVEAIEVCKSKETPKDFWPHFVVLREEKEEKTVLLP